MNSSNIMENAVKGAIASTVAVWIMDRPDCFMFESMDSQPRRRTEIIPPGGMDPADVATDRAANRLDIEIHPYGIATFVVLDEFISPALRCFASNGKSVRNGRLS